MARKNYGIDRLIQDVCDRKAAAMAKTFARLSKIFDSPIEVLFLQAIRECSGQSSGFFEVAGVVREPHEQFEKLTADDLDGFDVLVFRQIRFAGWPADFVVVAKDPNEVLHYAVVECDGHDFHERTKEQAKRDRSRDRAVQEAGARMFRFTGSEIFNDPAACALEVLRWSDGVMFPDEGDAS